jgi:hypothetical protein
MTKTVGDFLVSRLHAWGVRRIYGYPEYGINLVFGALNRANEKVEFVQARHEEMATARLFWRSRPIRKCRRSHRILPWRKSRILHQRSPEVTGNRAASSAAPFDKPLPDRDQYQQGRGVAERTAKWPQKMTDYSEAPDMDDSAFKQRSAARFTSLGNCRLDIVITVR